MLLQVGGFEFELLFGKFPYYALYARVPYIGEVWLSPDGCCADAWKPQKTLPQDMV